MASSPAKSQVIRFIPVLLLVPDAIAAQAERSTPVRVKAA
jgi:hypothetical protein